MKNTDINSLIFGSFIEHIENCVENGIFWKNNKLCDENGIRKDVLELSKELSPTIMRFPGGTVMGIYHWLDYVGPIDERKHVKNIVWGGRMTYEFGTCEYIEFCREIGAEPMICINMPTGTPEEAAQWVEFCNGTEDTHYANLRRQYGYEEPFNVKYWCIGNESFAVPDLGVQHDVNTYIREAWEYTKYMKMTDPTIELVFVGHDEEWNKAVLNELSPVCDYLSIHHYGMGDDPFSQNAEFEQKLIKIEKLLDEVNGREISFDRWYRIPHRSHDIKISLDEWNIWNTEGDKESQYGLQQRYTWRDALWVASFINLMIRHSKYIGIANLAQLVNVIAPIITEEDCSWKQTIFYPFSLFRKYCKKEYINIDNYGKDVVLTKTGEDYTLFGVNITNVEKTIELPFEAVDIINVCGEKLYATNSKTRDIVNITKINVNKQIQVTIPAYSFCIVSNQPL